MNYVSRSRSRKSGLAAQLYDFLHNLSETARGQRNCVLVVSIPASELEMTAQDQSDYDRFKKMLDRLGKPVVMSAEAETSEIIRRRLFEWDLRAVGQDGRVLLTKDAVSTCSDYADWLLEHRQSIPAEFPIDDGRRQFGATYPFHPVVLSVFERKWQTLPRFQQTRGMLRLLAQWVSNAYSIFFESSAATRSRTARSLPSWSWRRIRGSAMRRRYASSSRSHATMETPAAPTRAP